MDDDRGPEVASVASVESSMGDTDAEVIGPQDEADAAQDVLALVNQVLRKGTKGKEFGCQAFRCGRGRGF